MLVRNPARSCVNTCTFWGVISIVMVDFGWFDVIDRKSENVVEPSDYSHRLVDYVLYEDRLGGSVKDRNGALAYWFVIHKDAPTRSRRFLSEKDWKAALTKPE